MGDLPDGARFESQALPLDALERINRTCREFELVWVGELSAATFACQGARWRG